MNSAKNNSSAFILHVICDDVMVKSINNKYYKVEVCLPKPIRFIVNENL